MQTTLEEGRRERRYGYGGPEAADAAVRRLQRIARLMDSSIRVPLIGKRIGLDGLLGLLPVGGDAVGAAVSGYIVYEAYRLGYGNGRLTAMIGNIALDALIGSIPLVGDLFDFVFKANERNLRWMGIGVDPDKPDEKWERK